MTKDLRASHTMRRFAAATPRTTTSAAAAAVAVALAAAPTSAAAAVLVDTISAAVPVDNIASWELRGSSCPQQCTALLHPPPFPSPHRGSRRASVVGAADQRGEWAKQRGRAGALNTAVERRARHHGVWRTEVRRGDPPRAVAEHHVARVAEKRWVDVLHTLGNSGEAHNTTSVKQPWHSLMLGVFLFLSVHRSGCSWSAGVKGGGGREGTRSTKRRRTGRRRGCCGGGGEGT